MKILGKDEAAALVAVEGLARRLREDYVVIERPKGRGKITLKGGVLELDGEYYAKAAFVRNLDISGYVQDIESDLLRYLEYVEAKELIEEADMAAELRWVADRREDLAREAGTPYMYAPQLVKTLIDRLARAEYREKKAKGEDIA